MNIRCIQKWVNYRTSRDYAKWFDWTYELNCDLYHCHNKSKANFVHETYETKLGHNVPRIF